MSITPSSLDYAYLLLSFCLLLSMAVKTNTSQACAACKYQRRRCTPECPLAPHFPADQPKIFQNAHRLFGVANMTRILKQVGDEQKDDAMQSIKYESNMWEKFPRYGCCAVIWQLREQIQAYQAEVCYVRSLIEMVRDEKYFCGDHGLDSDSRSRNPNPNPPPWVQFKEFKNYVENGNCDEGTNYDQVEMKPYAYMDDAREGSDLSNGSETKERIRSSVEGDEMKNSEAWFNLTSFNRD